MISKLKLVNFKSHRNTEIPLRRLTVLSGMNSSGKSSIVQALLLLRQSHLKGSLGAGLDLNESLCALGKGQDIHCHMANDKVLKICFVDGEEFEFSFDVDERALGSTFLKKLRYGENVTPGKLASLSLFNSGFQYVSTNRLGGESHFDQYDYEVNELHQISRQYGRGDAVAQYLCQYGRDVIDVRGENGTSSTLIEEVVRWERKISPGLTIDPQKDPSGGFNVFYGYAHDGVKPISDLSARNVGFGISHSLPVIVALLSAKPGDLIILENPEAHLHPAGQSVVAELIARATRYGVQVLLETHSDHIIDGILLATKRFEDDDQDVRGIDRHSVALCHVSNDAQNPVCSSVCMVEIKGHGLLKYQPKGFFDQSEIDFRALCEA